MAPPSVAYGPPRAAAAPRGNPFFRRSARIYRSGGLVTEAAVTGLTLYLPQARTLRREPRWDEEGTPLATGAGVRLLGRTPYTRPGAQWGVVETLWLVTTPQGLRGWIIATNYEIEGGLQAAYSETFPDEDMPSSAALLSAIPDDRTPLVGPAASPPASTGGYGGYALAGLAAVLVAAGLYALSSED